MNIRNVVAVVAMVLVAAVSLVYMTFIGLPVTANFGVRNASFTVAQSSGLVTGSKVLYRGVEIGRVTGVKATHEGVVVDWNYKDSYDIPVSSAFRIDNLSALGESYIEIVPTGDSDGEFLSDGAVLAAGEVHVPTTVDELSARVVQVLEQVDPADVNAVTSAINTGLVNDDSILANLNSASGLLERTIVATRVPMETLLSKFQDLLANGSAVSDSLASARPGLTKFGDEFRVFLDWCVKFIVEDNLPHELTDGAGVFLQHALDELNRAAPDLKVIGDVALPEVHSGVSRLKNVDLSQLLRTALASAGDGTGIVIGVGGK